MFHPLIDQVELYDGYKKAFQLEDLNLLLLQVEGKFGLLLAAGKITEEVVQNIGSWKHSGFSVDQSVCLETGDREAIQCLIQYFLRCPFSQARMIDVTEAGKVLYKSSHPPSSFVPRTTAWQATNWADFPRPLARICWPVPSATSRFSIHWISWPK